MDQRARMASLDAFKNNEVALLICSDVAARGLDIPDVSHVFNFDIPTHAEDYVHRIGRTGRAGRSGTAYSIVTRADQRYIDDIEKLITTKIDWFGPALSELGPSTSDEDDAPRGRGRRERAPARGRESREGRGSRPPREARAPHPVEAEQPEIIEAAPAPVAAPRSRDEAAPRRQDGRRPDGRSRDPRRSDTRPEPRSQENRPQRGRGRDDDDVPVVGLGDHVPSFLLRPVKLKPLKAVSEE
jgi:superfamily II DNA/RNA helicase